MWVNDGLIEVGLCSYPSWKEQKEVSKIEWVTGNFVS
jgi:hypothetical protein